MLSDLLQASSDGDLNKVNQLLAQPSSLDIEQKGTSFSPLPLFCPTSPSHSTLHPVLRASLPSLPITPKDQDGVTPLIAAVKNGHRDVVKALLGHGMPNLPTLHLALVQHVATYQVPTLPMPRLMASRSSTRQMPTL